MFNSKIRIIIILTIIIAIGGVITSYLIKKHRTDYKEQILDWRNQKDYFFKTDPGSPITDQEAFEALSYFEPQFKYKIKAHLSVLKDSTNKVLFKNSGTKKEYKKFGIASFRFNKKEYQLLLLQAMDTANSNLLFLPFTDITSGESTYKGGRYLDVHYTGKTNIIIDFNYAYNPYCAYNQRYSCPFPPKENNLDLEIEAGEKMEEEKAKEEEN